MAARALSRPLWHLLFWIGNRARRRQLWWLALIAYRLSIWCDPAGAKAWMHYGTVQRRLGRDRAGQAALDRALALAPQSHAIVSAAMAGRPRGPVPDRLGFVILGTTGLCNASCLHCPTGKASTAHVPRMPMAMPLFYRLIDELAELGLPITGQIAFGLFGDALVDPFVVERARYARARFPDVPISINTNAAAFSRKRHAMLRDLDVTIGLHCESLVAETFGELMQPLRLERVLPRYEQILEIFAGRVHVSIPVNRRNLADVAQTKRWFVDRGATVYLAPMMSRCARDRQLFDTLALAPVPMRCSSAVLDDLAIDCDGTVLRCCQDFTRAEPIASLAETPLREIVFGAARRRHAALLDQGRHAESATCSRCFGDIATEITGFVPGG